MGFLSPLSKGDRLPTAMETWNAILESARAYHRSRGAVEAENKPLENSIEVLVKNTTGGNLGRFAIVKLTDPIPTPTANLSEFQERRVVTAIAPTSTATIAILKESIPNNEIGAAVVLGLTPVQLNVTASGDTYAFSTTSTTELTTGTNGQCKIVYKQPGTGSGLWGLVNMQGQLPLPSVASNTIFNADITNLSYGDTRYIFPADGVYLVTATLLVQYPLAGGTGGVWFAPTLAIGSGSSLGTLHGVTGQQIVPNPIPSGTASGTYWSGSGSWFVEAKANNTLAWAFACNNGQAKVWKDYSKFIVTKY